MTITTHKHTHRLPADTHTTSIIIDHSGPPPDMFMFMLELILRGPARTAWRASVFACVGCSQLLELPLEWQLGNRHPVHSEFFVLLPWIWIQKKLCSFYICNGKIHTDGGTSGEILKELNHNSIYPILLDHIWTQLLLLWLQVSQCPIAATLAMQYTLQTCRWTRNQL